MSNSACELDQLAEQYEGEGTEFGRVMAKWCREEIARLQAKKLDGAVPER